jgi:uncharacterized membrane-anchored protein
MSTSHRAAALPPDPYGGSVFARPVANKVPEITIVFWVLKILCTTVAQGAVEVVEGTLGFGVANTIKVFAAVLAVILLAQFRLDRYVPVAYWLVAVVVCVLGTLVVDAMVDGDVSPAAGTPAVAALLGAVFAVWWSVEHALSLDTIVTTRREAFYWLAILLAFALGTAIGSLADEQTDLDYAAWTGLFATVVALVALADRLGANAIATFWLAFVATSPLAASLGDEVSLSDRHHGGLGLGMTPTCAIAVAVIAALVAYLTLARRDRAPSEATA